MEIDITRARTPGLLRRLAAMIYDLILLIGVLLLAVALVVLPYQGLSGSSFPLDGWVHHLFQVYLLCVWTGFFVYFWVKSGQTLGMRAWRLRLLRDDGRPLTVADAARRLLWSVVTLVPIGLLWMLLDAQDRGLHDILSKTRPVMLKKG